MAEGKDRRMERLETRLKTKNLLIFMLCFCDVNSHPKLKTAKTTS